MGLPVYLPQSIHFTLNEITNIYIKQRQLSAVWQDSPPRKHSKDFDIACQLKKCILLALKNSVVQAPTSAVVY